MDSIKIILENDFQGLFVEKIDSFKRKINAFGFYFASSDIRQDSRVIYRTLLDVFSHQPELKPVTFDNQDELEQIESLFSIDGSVNLAQIDNVMSWGAAQAESVSPYVPEKSEKL